METKTKLGQITLRRAEWADFPLFMNWRSLPHVYENMVECPYPPSEEEVANWLGSYVNDREERYGFLILFMVGGKHVGWGLARDFQSGIPEVGVTIAEKDYWGTGLVEEMAELGLQRVKQYGFAKVRAMAMKSNDRIAGFLKRNNWEKIYENEGHSAWIKEI